MKRLPLTIFFTVVSLVAFGQPSTPPKPNIIVIFAEDLGYGDIGPFGSTKNRTPNLDRMAREGMKLTSFCARPVCTPSRAQVLTGCYAKALMFFQASALREKTGRGSWANCSLGLAWSDDLKT